MSSTTTGFKVKPKEKKEIMIEEESVKVLVQAQVVPDAPKVEEEIDGVTIEEVSITDDWGPVMYDQELLFDTLCVQSKSNDDKLMMEFIERKIEEAKERGYPIENHTDAYGNIYVTKGTGFLSEAGHVSFPSIVCHTDTVHNVVKNFFVVEWEGSFIGMKKNDETGELCTSGIGGDDKVGVYTCLNALFQEGIESVKVSFFRNEEIGCIGSKAADMKWFEDVNWVCQLDRRGWSDLSTGMFSEDTNSLEWREEVIKIGKELGMSFLSTSISDVIQLKTNGIRVCTMNISSGYYNPHMSTEYVVGKDVSRSEYLVHEMIRKNGGRRFEHLKQPPKTYGYSNVYTSDNFYRGYAKSRWGQCCICGDRDFIDVETKICKDCEKISVDNKKNLEIVQKSLEGKTSVQALICCGHKMVYSKPGDIYVCETCCETQAAVPDTSDEADTEKESRPDIFLKKYYVGIFDGNRYYTEDDIIIESIQCQSCLCCEHTIKAHSMEVTCNQCFSRAMTGSIELEINFGGRIYVQNGNDKKFMLKEEAVKTSLYGPDIWVHREEDLEDATSLYGGGFYG